MTIENRADAAALEKRLLDVIADRCEGRSEHHESAVAMDTQELALVVIALELGAIRYQLEAIELHLAENL